LLEIIIEFKNFSGNFSAWLRWLSATGRSTKFETPYPLVILLAISLYLQPFRVLYAALQTVVIEAHAFETFWIEEPRSPIALMACFMIRYRRRSDHTLAFALLTKRLSLELRAPQPPPARRIIESLSLIGAAPR
jgi:hypothetical protein